jgi:methionine-rich copper-binding protein CopC
MGRGLCSLPFSALAVWQELDMRLSAIVAQGREVNSMRWFLGAAMLLGLAWSTQADAHAILVDSTPAISSKIGAGVVRLRLRFNSRIDAARSRLTLIRPDRTTQILPLLAGSADDVLLAETSLTDGAYVVRWQVLAVDGHITRGDVPFTVTGR